MSATLRVLIYFMVGLFIVGSPVALEAITLSFLEGNPQLKEKLMEWERLAPSDVKKDIDILRKSGDAVKKYHAAERLGQKRASAKGAILALIETFDDRTSLGWRFGGGAPLPTTSPADRAAKALGEIGKSAVDPLVEALKDENAFVRMSAAKALGEIKDLRAVDSLVKALKDNHIEVRRHAAEALGEIKDPRAVEPLIKTLKADDNMFVREDAREGLAKIGKPAVEPLIEALKDDETFVRRSAAETLGEIKDHQAVEPLIEALKDNYAEVRRHAAEALGEIKDPRAVEALADVLKDDDIFVRTAASNAIRTIKDARVVESSNRKHFRQRKQ